MQKLSVTGIQTTLFWKDVAKNLDNFQNKIENIKESTDIIVLPEMFSTGFVMEPEKYAETMDGKSVAWMKKMAKHKNSVIIGSLIIEHDKKYTNRLLAVFPDEKIELYDKRHLFSLAGENKTYSPGDKKLIIDYKSWKISTLICYDLRFPVWSRSQNDYDVLIYVANWPASRSFHWKILLQARAIENQAYVIGVNRIGADGNGTQHSGDSCAFDPFGHNISKMEPDQDITDTVVLDKEILEKNRKSYPFYNDRDKFAIC
jgi:omega-amidase